MTLTRHSFEAENTKKKSRLKAALLAGTALVGVGLFPSMPRSATITYTNGENDTTDYTLTSSDTFQTAAGGSITATQSGLLNLAGFAATLDAMAATDQLTFSDVISGTGSVLINGSGTIILSSTNTYSGGTSLSAGTLQAGNSSALGTGKLAFDGAGTTLVATTTIANAADLNFDATVSSLSGGTETANLTGVWDTKGNTLTINAVDAADTILFQGSGLWVRAMLSRLAKARCSCPQLPILLAAV